MDDSNQSRHVTATEQFMTQHPKGYRWSAVPGIDRALHFHEVMGLPVSHIINLNPTVTERVLRCQLMMEEVFECLHGMGIQMYHDGEPVMTGFDEITFDVIEGSRYDPVETLDGLADIKVIVNGTAVALGLPMAEADFEVFASNMTKLDADGKPRINQCIYGAPCVDHDDHECELFDPTKPVGKLLKPESYKPADIRQILFDACSTPSETLTLESHLGMEK